MKSTLLLKILFLLVLPLSVISQNNQNYQIELKSGSFTPEKNVGTGKVESINARLIPDKKIFVVIQFEEIPGPAERERLKAEGIDLLEYIPNNAYTATITGSLSEISLKRSKARAVISLTASQKLHPSLLKKPFPEQTRIVKGQVDVWINFPKSFSFDEIKEQLKTDQFEIISTVHQTYQVLEIRVPEDRLNELALKNYVQYVEPVPAPDKPNNINSTGNGRANVLNSSLPSGRNLHGEGVIVGVGDEANPLLHVDLSNRIINRAAIKAGGHGVHVMGTLAGAGIVNEKYTGYAPKAKIIAQYYSNILTYASTYVQDFGMVITNNSYGNDVTDCSSLGAYNLQSYILDQQAFQMPYLQHVFAAGNSGTMTCSPHPSGFGNIVGGYQTAKNVISVGNTTVEGIIATSSSRGPVKDGRIKPEISAQGSSLISSIPVNNYVSSTGTSMASPAVAGGLTLLYQRYRELHSQQNPKNGLMKAILVNGGTDQGNDGPDYKYGFGWMNLLRSVKMIESESYKTASIASSPTPQTYDIQIPANTAKVKVMLYWNDPAPSVLSGKNLVNDLDLTVTKPSAETVFPKLLDPTPANTNNPATTGADHINNIEQVIIDAPVAGNYQINVKGTAVNQNGTQEYFVVYDIIPVSTTITNPIGKERYAAADSIYVAWDSFGNSSNDFSVQYSTNDGAQWNPISGNLTANGRQLKWVFPNVSTDKARVKVIQNATGAESVSEAFTITGRPVLSLSSVQCEGYAALEWTPISGASDYEVMILKGGEMVSAGITSNTSFTFNGLSRDSTYWFAVRARINASPGIRSIAISRKPDSGNCSGTISDNDLFLEAIVNPVSSGRLLTSKALTNQNNVTIRIKNLDDQPFSGPVSVGYSVNGTAVASVSASLTIPAQASFDYTFSDKANLAAEGSYLIEAFANAPADTAKRNNKISQIFDQLNNAPITLPFLDNIESASVQEVTIDKTGLQNLSRYDFTNSTNAGRIRTFVNTGIAYSGSKALTLDTDQYYPAGNTNFLDGTFNLSNYNLSQDIRLNFRYKNHGQKSDPDNSVWLRGNYNDPWILVYNLFANQNPVSATYKLSSSIEVSNKLRENGQTLSTSTQIRWGQHGDIITADPKSGAGYSFDDIQLSIVTDDIQLISLNSVSQASCGLSNNQLITISVRNSSDHTITNIPVNYKLGNGSEVHEIIPSIDARTTTAFTFTTTQNMAAFGVYHLKVWTSLASDSYSDNNTIEIDIYNNQQISSFPYLENFETSSGNWHSSGTSNSWAYGTPASSKINKAASGTTAWKTNLSGNYNNEETSYLYSPCFDLTGMTNPTVSFSLALDIEFCASEDCDFAYLEYSADGNTWFRLGDKGQGINWYNKITEDNQGWSVQDYTRWHVGTMPLPSATNIRLRFVLRADSGTTREGIAIDDIHIYDNTNGIYDGSTTASPVTQNAPTSSGWINFVQNGQLVASVNPNSQTLGATAVQTFINSSAVRNNQLQYYLDRNITIKPANRSLAANTTVRIYFLDSESEKLINATGCGGCSKPASAYDLGISKYTDANANNEDGILSNNGGGSWDYLTAANVVKVPFDKGYYAEIQIKDFSEFWFNTGGGLQNGALPVELLSFNVTKKTGNDNSAQVIANWVTTTETNTDYFEIERVQGLNAFNLNQFKMIGKVLAAGNSVTQEEYSFTDTSRDQTTTNYYRLKMVDKDGSFQYSRIQSVYFDNKADWQTFPNPSTGIINVTFQGDPGTSVQIQTFDLVGNIVFNTNLNATGIEQKLPIDLSGSQFPSGLYLIEVTSQRQKKAFRIMKL
ncbi:S8 family serine peptidase [Dyadobacter subterraneus]|uniref:S8 family serine peptidase n=1 Tax=Dyadobacter subterraneus TaxID=2773304 RepID=A0ABR9WDF8_9BACT|nr:S8 family serine peptidase [Dyadobacter subterraneus]MBE9463164.1 S8 family serine peptidase [Dyadobacter subterraneus]